MVDMTRIHLYPPVWIAFGVSMFIGLWIWGTVEKRLTKDAKTSVLAKTVILAIPLAAAILAVSRWVEKKELLRHISSVQSQRDAQRQRADAAQRRLAQLQPS